MKTIVLLIYDLVLSEWRIECYTCYTSSVACVRNSIIKRLTRDIKEGFISPDYRIKVVDRLSTNQSLF